MHWLSRACVAAVLSGVIACQALLALETDTDDARDAPDGATDEPRDAGEGTEDATEPPDAAPLRCERTSAFGEPKVITLTGPQTLRHAAALDDDESHVVFLAAYPPFRLYEAARGTGLPGEYILPRRITLPDSIRNPQTPFLVDTDTLLFAAIVDGGKATAAVVRATRTTDASFVLVDAPELAPIDAIPDGVTYPRPFEGGVAFFQGGSPSGARVLADGSESVSELFEDPAWSSSVPIPSRGARVYAAADGGEVFSFEFSSGRARNPEPLGFVLPQEPTVALLSWVSTDECVVYFSNDGLIYRAARR